MNLFDRNYLVRISDLDDQNNVIQFEIKPPFNVAFECRRKISGGNSLDLTIYGLGSEKRLLLSKRRYEFAEGLAIENGRLKSQPVQGLKKVSTERGGKELIIEFFLGYGDSLKRVFLGEVVEVESQLADGQFETTLLAVEDYSARQRTYTARTVTSKTSAIRQLMTDPGLEVGLVFLGTNDYVRPKIISGRPLDILKEMASNPSETFFTDNGKGYYLPTFPANTSRAPLPV